MKKSVFLGFALLGAASLVTNVESAPRKSAKKAPLRLAWAPKAKTKAKVAPKRLDASKLPQYVSLGTIKQLRAQRGPIPVLQPFWEGHAIKRPMRDLLDGPAFDAPALPKVTNAKKGANPTLLAQVFPRPIAPAAVPSGRGGRRAAPTVIPRWTRYPLEFQLCGIGLGSRAVDKDRFNRIDRYGLFAIHGNPTAVVVPSAVAITGGAGAPGGAEGAAPGPVVAAGITIEQQPPEAASLFPGSVNGGLPDWASAITVSLDNNHVQWLYNRGSYSMGFVVDRLGFVDAVVVAGVQSPIAYTQLEDPVHTVKLGDDLRKVLFRYGYPDSIETFGVTASAVAGVVANVGAGAGADAGAGGGPQFPDAGAGQAGAGGAAGAAVAGNGAFRTFELRYEQSYNVVFTIRNNRVVRVYIFGDPDFFTLQRRNALRTRY